MSHIRSENADKRRGWLNLAACVMLWALIPVVAKIGQNDMDHHQFLFWSSLFSFVTLFSLAIVKGKVAELKRLQVKDGVLIFGLGLLGTYVYYLLLYQGYAENEGLIVLVLQYTWPIFIALLATLLLNEVFTLRVGAAAVLGLFGVLVVLSKGQWQDFDLDLELSVLWVALGAFCFALFSVLSKKVHYEPFSLNTGYFAAATMAALISMMSFSEFSWPMGNAWWSVLANGIFINGVSYLFWLQALRNLPANQAAIAVFATPIISTLYLSVFFDEVLLPVYLLGIVCVLAAGLLVTAPKRA